MKKREIYKKINRNYYFAKTVRNLALLQTNEKQQLEIIKYLGHFHSSYVTGLYSDGKIEDCLIKIGKKIKFESKVMPQKGKILHVMTRAYGVGGHTAAVNNWINFDDSRQYSIVFTESIYAEVPIFLREAVKRSGGKLYFLGKGSIIDKAKKLLEISQSFEKIVLHTHMYDTIPTLAYSNNNWNIPVYFYNHANFSLSYGYSVADCVLNLCMYDKWKSEKYRGVKNNEVLGIPDKEIDDMKGKAKESDKNKFKDSLIRNYGLKENSKIVISMGSNFKYKKIIGYDFALFVKRLLLESDIDIYFFIIGADPKEERWHKLKEETRGHAIALGVLPRNIVSQWMKIADLYIVSYPMPGAGYTEADKYSVPYFRLVIVNRKPEGWDDSMVKSEDELIDKSIRVLKGELDYSRLNINKYEERRDKKVWCSKLNQIFDKPLNHCIHKIVSQRFIMKEEIVNCQLRDSTKFEYERECNLNIMNKLIILFAKKIYSI